jgi:hypothetical protein
MAQAVQFLREVVDRQRGERREAVALVGARQTGRGEFVVGGVRLAQRQCRLAFAVAVQGVVALRQRPAAWRCSS